jgi:ElaB/YqjD/DUF883 family membrane-anchored ribosome-binding protein
MEDSSSNPGNPSSGNAGNIQRGVDSAGAAAHETIDKLAGPTRSTVDRMSNAAHETVDKLASEATHMADRISDQARRMTEAPTRAVECSKSWVQDKPLEAVGIALAVGFIIGRLTAR